MTIIFNEIYGSYYNVVAEVLAEAVNGTLTKEKLNEITARKAFGESIVTIPDSILSGKWPFISKNTFTQTKSGGYTTPLKHIPTMPLTTIQKMWLRAILEDPRIKLFEPVMEGLEDVQPLYDRDTIVYFDRYSDGDPYEDDEYKEHFRLVLLAIREHRILRIKYDGRNTRKYRTLIPYKLEYSSKNDRFRLIGMNMKGSVYTFNLARIRSVELMEMYDKKIHDIYLNIKFDTAQVVAELTDERRALERAMYAFSDLEKETVRLDDTRYRITITYRVEDETELLIRILAFGPMLKVIEPESFVNLIRDRLSRQRKL